MHIAELSVPINLDDDNGNEASTTMGQSIDKHSDSSFHFLGKCRPVACVLLVVMILVFWCAALRHSIEHAMDLLHHLGDVKFDPPDGTRAAAAREALVTHAPLKLETMFPLSVIVYLQGKKMEDGGHSTVETPEVRDFAEALATTLRRMRLVVAFNGYNVSSGSQETRVGRGRSFYMAPDNSSTIFVLHLRNAAVPSAYHAPESLCRSWTARGASLEGYGCLVWGEYSFGRTARESAATKFENVDSIGVPAAMVALLCAVGPLALLVLITLPVGILCSFDACLQLTLAYPHKFEVPTFAPCLLVSFTVAMCLDYALFMSSRYRAEIRSGLSSSQALIVAYFSSGRTMLVSGLIMIVSNLGSLLIPNVAVKSLSVSIAVCSAVTTILNLTLLPVLLLIIGPLLLHLESALPRCFSRLCFGCTQKLQSRAVLRHADMELMPLNGASPQMEDGQSMTPMCCLFRPHEPFWRRLAQLVTSRPITVMAAVLVLGLPVCLQASRLKYSLALTALVPMSCEAMQTMAKIGEEFPLGTCDIKRFIVLPRDVQALKAKRLLQEDCVNDEPSVRAWAAEAGYDHGSCKAAISVLGCDYSLGHFIDAEKTNRSAFLSDYCPRSCPGACTAASVLSRPFMDFIKNVTMAVQALTHKFAYARGLDKPFNLVESSATLDEKPISFRQAETYLTSAVRSSNSSCSGPSCEAGQRYAERLQALSNFDRSVALLNGVTSFSPFADGAFDWANAVYEALEPNVITDTPDGPIVINSPTHDYTVLFGDLMNDMAAAVDDLFASSPAILLSIVISTVMLASLLGFRSVLIGPRLLLTVLFTLSFTFGLSVIIFQDLSGGGGVHWVVLLVSVPIMLGLTLDYDIFLLSRCYELRLAGDSTQDAVTKALRDTGPVITTAGIIMILAFGGLIFTDVPCLCQLGAVLLTCCLVDTFVVRTLLVPAMMLVMVDYNWWPGWVPPPNSRAAC